MVRIFGVPWHVSHNYSLLQIPGTKWSLLENNVRKWNNDARQIPAGVEFVSEFDPGKYDLAVLHVDQQSLDPRIGKAQFYRALNKNVTGIPKIVINHGTPFWPEKWQGIGNWRLPAEIENAPENKRLAWEKDFLIEGGKTLVNGEEATIEGMKELIGDNFMIVNSYRAKEQWGFGHVIWHGLKQEFFDLPKEPRSVTALSAAGLDYYYGRDFLNAVIGRLRDDFGLRHTHIGNPYDWTVDRHYRRDKLDGFGCYRDFLGRSLIYFNPTRESPMPRSRTEAMLSGCCVVSTGTHDADKFINFDTATIWRDSEGLVDYLQIVDRAITKDAGIINGFIVPFNPIPVAGLIYHLIYNRYKEAVKIGQNGKRMAEQLFSQDRYHKDWQLVIDKVLGGKNGHN